MCGGAESGISGFEKEEKKNLKRYENVFQKQEKYSKYDTNQQEF